jgi:hypothetical protein
MNLISFLFPLMEKGNSKELRKKDQGQTNAPPVCPVTAHEVSPRFENSFSDIMEGQRIT